MNCYECEFFETDAEIVDFITLGKCTIANRNVTGNEPFCLCPEKKAERKRECRVSASFTD